MATKTVNSTSFEVTLDAIEETDIIIANLNPLEAYGLVIKIVVTGGPVKFNTQGSASDGRSVTDDTVYLTLLNNRLKALPTNLTDSITGDI